MLKRGKLNNCKKCLASYGQYNLDTNSDWEEYWCKLPLRGKKGEVIKPKGVCQFCNHKSIYYIKSVQ